MLQLIRKLFKPDDIGDYVPAKVRRPRLIRNSIGNHRTLDKVAVVLTPMCEKTTCEWKAYVDGTQIYIYDYKATYDSGHQHLLHLQGYGGDDPSAAIERFITLHELE